MRRRTGYELLSGVTLAIAGAATVVAAAGAALQQALSVAAASLCAAVFAVPGLYFLGYSRRLRSRDIALVHVAAFATEKRTFDTADLATELNVSKEDAERILRAAMREGHLHGRLDNRGRFVTDSTSGPGGPA